MSYRVIWYNFPVYRSPPTSPSLSSSNGVKDFFDGMVPISGCRAVMLLYLTKHPLQSRPKRQENAVGSLGQNAERPAARDPPNPRPGG